MKNLLDLVSYAGPLFPIPGSGYLPIPSAKAIGKVSDAAVTRLYSAHRATKTTGLKTARNGSGKNDRVTR